MIKRVLLLLAFSAAALACTPSGSSPTPVESGPAVESPSVPAASPSS